MTISTLDHVNIRTTRMAESLRFYEQVLEMQAAPAPGTADMAVGAWIHSEDGRPVIHLNAAPQGADFLGEERDWAALQGSAQIHHIAVRCTNYDATRAQLEAEGLALHFNEVPQVGLRQIFVRDPNDILIEMNFIAE